jgi:hypothetical protein
MLSGDGSHHHSGHPGHSTSQLAGGSRIVSPDLTRPGMMTNDSVAPGDSASHAGAESPRGSLLGGAIGGDTPERLLQQQQLLQPSPAEVPFPFKFKAPSGRVHRLQVVAAQGVGAFVSSVTAKLGPEVEAVGGAAVVDEDGKLSGGYALSYLDDEGDSVSITTDNDLLEAILLARQRGRDKVDLFVHDPDKPAAPPVAEPAAVPLPTPPASSAAGGASGLRERRRALNDDDDDDEHDEYDEEDDEEDDGPVARRSARRTKTAPPPAQEQVIAGVPNELLLPGAIVTLAVVIVGVFAISRASGR